MKRVAGTYNPFFRIPGFLNTVFIEDNAFYVQKYHRNKLEDYFKTAIDPARVRSKYTSLSMGEEFQENDVIYSFQSEDDRIYLGNLAEMIGFLRREIKIIESNFLKRRIAKFIRDEALEGYFSFVEKYNKDHPDKYDFKERTAVSDPILKDLPKPSLSREDFTMPI